MTRDLWTEVDRYISDVQIPPDAAIDEADAGCASHSHRSRLFSHMRGFQANTVSRD